MTKLIDEAKAYEPPKTKNIADLDSIPVDIDVVEREFTKEDGSTFKMKVIVLNDEDYRVPTSVLKSLKAIVEEKPDLKKFKVIKTGEGMKTSYTIVTQE